ncbi:MAG: disulfide bond formation protein B [Bacteroidetes bacterium]|nr:disulfide bond formation protein B [Bacteroidota bacterium]
MPAYVEIVNKILALGTIFLQIVILLIALNFIFNRSRNNKILIFFKDYTFYLGFLIALGAVALSLFYSEIVGFPPCELCWIQRIFLYPQLVLFGMELYKKEKSIVDFSIVFAILGAITSIYHVFVESGALTGPACADPSRGGVSCAIRYIYEFGYVTMPIMALTMSLFIISILLNYKYMSKN